MLLDGGTYDNTGLEALDDENYADVFLVAMNAGPDPDGFMDFFARELAAPLRALAP